MDFVAIDFETANTARSSPCSAALIRFRNGRPVESWSRLMRPPVGFDHFDMRCVTIHGITESKVATQPRFGDLWPEMSDFIGDDLLVAHNAGFDMSVLRDSAIASSIALPEIEYACTLRLARMTLDLLSYGLVWVADALGVDLNNHHEAEADALAAGEVFVALARRLDAYDLDEFEQALGRVTIARQIRPKRSRPRSDGDLTADLLALGGPLPLPPFTPTPDHPLFDRHVAFSGGLQSMTRAEAFELVTACGGTPQPSVTKKTNILVLGPALFNGELLDGDLVTGKMARAAELRQKGQSIEIMSEDDFRNSV